MIPSRIEAVNRAIRCWQEAGRKLGIRVVAPYALEAEGGGVDCLAFLPDFGKSNGMVIGVTMPPEWETDARLTRLAKVKGLFVSFINPVGWTDYDEAQFKDALIDWGYFGPSENRPRWFTEKTGQDHQKPD